VTGGTTTRHNDGDGRQHNGRHHDGTGQHGDGLHDNGDEWHDDAAKRRRWATR
jgi:hypothetical protein